jgi:hypothetical protein
MNPREQQRRWELDRDIFWVEPEPTWPNGRYRAYFEATKAQAKAITAYVDDCLESGEGDLFQFEQGDTKSF